DTVGTAAVIITVFKAFDAATRTTTEMVIHNVVAQLAAAASQAIGPDIRCRIHQYPGAVERGSVQKDDLRLVLMDLIGFRIQHLYADGSFGILIVQYPRHDRPRTKRQIACFYSCRKCG